MPLHDLDPRFCNSLAQSEAGKFEKFADRRRKKAAGIGQIGEVASEGSLVVSALVSEGSLVVIALVSEGSLVVSALVSEGSLVVIPVSALVSEG